MQAADNMFSLQRLERSYIALLEDLAKLLLSTLLEVMRTSELHRQAFHDELSRFADRLRAIEQVKTEAVSPLSLRVEEVARACFGDKAKRDYRIRKEARQTNIQEEDIISAYINKPHKQRMAGEQKHRSVEVSPPPTDTQPTASRQTRLSSDFSQVKPLYRELSRLKIQAELASPDIPEETLREKMRSIEPHMRSNGRYSKRKYYIPKLM